MKVFDPRHEMMPRAELEQLQLERLQSLLVRLKRNVRRYRERIADIILESIEDLARLPETTPGDLVESFPYGMFAQPLREVIRLNSLVGPEGRPLVTGHTRHDLTQWGRLGARQLFASGVTVNDVIQICLGGGARQGSSGYVLGAETLGASVIAEDPFHVDYQLAMLQNYRPTVLITTPTNAMELIRLLNQRRVDPQSLNLRTILLSRPVDADTRRQLQAGLFSAVQCNFGVREILDPGLCVECEHGRFHVNEDQFLVEIHDGELLVTTLCREAVPLLRYHTQVNCEAHREKCACGRTGIILAPGTRRDRRLRVNEAPLYEHQIADVLQQTSAAGHSFQLEVLERSIIVRLEMTEDLMHDTVWPIINLQRELQSEFYARLGIEAEIVFVEKPPRR
jgi:phenylacetate-CoA ligase